MLYGWTQRSEFEGRVGCKDVMVWEVDMQPARIVPRLTYGDSTAPIATASSPNKVMEWVQTFCVCSHGHVWLPSSSLDLSRHPRWPPTFILTESARKWLRHKVCKQTENGTEVLTCKTWNVVEMKWGSYNATCFQLWAGHTKLAKETIRFRALVDRKSVV